MNNEEFEKILTDLSDVKNLPNNKLIEVMDKLATDFDMTKTNIINMTVYLDKIEELYDKTLAEYESRK
jgi:predicted ATP-grasp superfamily ATP-dependent carboligase